MASWRGQSVFEKEENCLTGFCSLEKGINYYYPPDSCFAGGKPEKAFA